MVSHRSPQLSKSRYMAGLQCLKRLYLETYRRELADPVDQAQQARFDAGTAVGELARQRFPGGKLVAEEYYQHEQAVRTTRRLLRSVPVPPIYEAAFSFEGIRTRVDVLYKNEGPGFDMVEVKSSTGVSPVHIPDVAIQMHVLEGAGVPVDRAWLMHVNNAYMYEGGPYDPEQLFSLEDVTEQARAFAADNIGDDLDRMWEALRQGTEPDIETGRHCNKPYKCSFFGHCHRNGPEHPIRQLPRLGAKLWVRLREGGIQEIGSIPADFPGLNDTQRRVRDSVVMGAPFVGPDLAGVLDEISYPVSFMDFETVGPALPLYVGTRPYQTVPFQWSLHIRDADGGLTHREFLNGDADDPRERFVVSLLDAVPSEGSVVVYSSFEKSRLTEMARLFPQHENRLEALCARLFDLLDVVRGHYYHPGFHGSYSLKSTLPALVPDLSYGDLEIQGGDVASIGYTRMIAADTPEPEKAEIQEAMLAYCKRDTEAMVRVLDALHAEARGST